MVQRISSPTQATSGFRPLSDLEVFQRLGIQIKTPAPKAEVTAPEPEKKTVTDEPVLEPKAEALTPEESAPAVSEQDETSTEQEAVSDVPLSDLKLRKTYITALQANGINTVNDLTTYLESGKTLEELPDVSEAAIKSITEKLEQWQKNQNPTI